MRRQPRFRDVVSDKLLLAVRVVAVEHLGFLHSGDLQQLRLDFVQFDPVPADFHLVVDPAQIFDVAVRKPS
ncbi:hypothetical protein, partial [Paenibacillus sp. S-12]|uniref:hypothetical protein n=1 Tax=Paenibacillus sp. S-12 TaxID=3031371 RepID=UPI0025A1F9D3